MAGILHDKTVQMLLSVVVTLGAVNWAVIEFLDTDLLLDVLGVAAGSGELTAIYAVIGAAAVIRFASVVDWVTDGSLTGMNRGDM